MNVTVKIANSVSATRNSLSLWQNNLLWKSGAEKKLMERSCGPPNDWYSFKKFICTHGSCNCFTWKDSFNATTASWSLILFELQGLVVMAYSCIFDFLWRKSRSSTKAARRVLFFFATKWRFTQSTDHAALRRTMADPGEAVWGNFPPKRLWRPLKMAPLW